MLDTIPQPHNSFLKIPKAPLEVQVDELHTTNPIPNCFYPAPHDSFQICSAWCFGQDKKCG